MTLSPKNPGRLAVFFMALIYTTLTFGVAVSPAEAKTSGPYYTAELVEAAKDDRVVAKGVAWKCAGTTCRAGKGHSRPINICRGLHRKFGEIKSFTAKGEALPADKLAKCNGK